MVSHFALVRAQLQLAGVNMSLPTGARCMLVGANGAGKTTLMSVIGGKHMVSEDSVRVLGRPAFEDTSLSAELALLTGNWTHTVAFAGHNVPFQAMEVHRLIASNSVGVDPERVSRLVRLLEVDPTWNLTTVSDGQRRRVQILCKLIKPFKILLLDEITTDLDLLARHDLLSFLREESEERGVTIVYCTHIFDGLDGWASHVAYVQKGEMIFCKPMEGLTTELAVPAAQQARGWGALFCAVQRWLLEARPDFAKLLTTPKAEAAFSPPASVHGLGPAVSLRDFSWTYSGAKKANQLQNLTFDVPRGARCLLVGANGAGKSTLLKLIGGKHMVPRGAVTVLGRPAFHDLVLNTMVALLSGDWTRTIASVGNGVPYQADFKISEMCTRFVDALVRDGLDRDLVEGRLARLVALLGLDLEWRLHKVSDGQRRRAQLLLKLLRPSDLLLLDEVTTDLDLTARQALLTFLKEESTLRGVTVVYSTHIFDGLDDWPDTILHLAHGKVRYAGAAAAAPRAAATAESPQASGSLFHMVSAWLREERDARRAAAAVPDVAGCPTTDEAFSAAAAPPAAPKPAAAPSSFGSKFDRFGGGSRQGMYAR